MKKLIAEYRKLDFFKNENRIISDKADESTSNEFSYHVLYRNKENTNTINTILVLRGGYRQENKNVPGMVMVTAENVIVKYDVDAAQIVVSFAQTPSHEGIVVEFDSTVEEGEFFQESLLTDMRGLTFEYIELVRDVFNVAKEHDTE